MRLRAWGLEVGVQGLGSRVQGLGFRVQSVGFGVQGVGFRVQSLRFIQNVGVGVPDLGDLLGALAHVGVGRFFKPENK